MAAELPPTAQGLQRPPPVNRSSKWSLFGSSLVILAFSLRLLGDKWEHQAEQAALQAELEAARAEAASLRAELDGAYAGKKRPPPAAAQPKAAPAQAPAAPQPFKKTLF